MLETRLIMLQLQQNKCFASFGFCFCCYCLYHCCQVVVVKGVQFHIQEVTAELLRWVGLGCVGGGCDKKQ